MIIPIGHQSVLERFLRALGKGQLPHAWLLYGLMGIGKSVLAEAMAATYLCGRNMDPGHVEIACGECHACRMLAAGSHPDYFKTGILEKKRDVRIEQVRDMLGFLQLSGAESGRRVAILDDAELLNKQAANALLKGLEEPAPGSLILLLSSNPSRLPPTVRSRSLLQAIAPLSREDCLKVLRGMQIAEPILPLAADLACGCPGRVACMHNEDICSALEQLRELTADPAELDIGRMELWLGRNSKRVPHDLIIEVILQYIYPSLYNKYDVSSNLAIDDAMSELLEWPELVRRHSLRPAQSFLARMLRLRLVLRDARQAA